MCTFVRENWLTTLAVEACLGALFLALRTSLVGYLGIKLCMFASAVVPSTALAHLLRTISKLRVSGLEKAAPAHGQLVPNPQRPANRNSCFVRVGMPCRAWLLVVLFLVAANCRRSRATTDMACDAEGSAVADSLASCVGKWADSCETLQTARNLAVPGVGECRLSFGMVPLYLLIITCATCSFFGTSTELQSCGAGCKHGILQQCFGLILCFCAGKVRRLLLVFLAALGLP